jgi:hypothetical protein
MDDPVGFLKGATLQYASVRPNNGSFVHLFGLNTLSGIYWFNAQLIITENEDGYGYTLLVGDFGRN